MNRLHEFFEVKGVYSMRNLTIFVTILIGSLIVAALAINGKLTAEIFAIYMLAGGGVYGFGKWQDDKTRRSEIDATVEQQPINTTINQPEKVNIPGASDK